MAANLPDDLMDLFNLENANPELVIPDVLLANDERVVQYDLANMTSAELITSIIANVTEKLLTGEGTALSTINSEVLISEIEEANLAPAAYNAATVAGSILLTGMSSIANQQEPVDDTSYEDSTLLNASMQANVPNYWVGSGLAQLTDLTNSFANSDSLGDALVEDESFWGNYFQEFVRSLNPEAMTIALGKYHLLKHHRNLHRKY